MYPVRGGGGARDLSLRCPDGYCSVQASCEQTVLGENCALAANQSVDCRVTTLFTIGLNSAKV